MKLESSMSPLIVSDGPHRIEKTAPAALQETRTLSSLDLGMTATLSSHEVGNAIVFEAESIGPNGSHLRGRGD